MRSFKIACLILLSALACGAQTSSQDGVIRINVNLVQVDAVVTDSRFLLVLFLPFLFVASRFVLGLGEDRSLGIMRRRLSCADLVAASLICLALIDVAYNLLRIGRLIS